MSEQLMTEQERTTPLHAPMDQLPGKGPRPESPLYHADLASLAEKGPIDGGVHLQELALLGHLVLRGSLQNESFATGFAQVMGFALPGPMESAEEGILQCVGSLRMSGC